VNSRNWQTRANITVNNLTFTITCRLFMPSLRIERHYICELWVPAQRYGRAAWVSLNNRKNEEPNKRQQAADDVERRRRHSGAGGGRYWDVREKLKIRIVRNAADWKHIGMYTLPTNLTADVGQYLPGAVLEQKFCGRKHCPISPLISKSKTKCWMDPSTCGTILHNKIKIGVKLKCWQFRSLENFSS